MWLRCRVGTWLAVPSTTSSRTDRRRSGLSGGALGAAAAGVVRVGRPDGLAGAAARVEHEAVALQLLMAGEALRLAQHVRGGVGCRRGQGRRVLVVRLGDHQDVV